jgi:hypothetical protein
MCGRYSMFSSIDVVQDRFNAEALETWSPHYNAAPSQRLPVILNDKPKVIRLAEWGFRPKWLEGRAGPINARGGIVSQHPREARACDVGRRTAALGRVRHHVSFERIAFTAVASPPRAVEVKRPTTYLKSRFAVVQVDAATVVR